MATHFVLLLFAVCEFYAHWQFRRAATIFSPCPSARRRPPRPLSQTTAELLAKLGVTRSGRGGRDRRRCP